MFEDPDGEVGNTELPTALGVCSLSVVRILPPGDCLPGIGIDIGIPNDDLKIGGDLTLVLLDPGVLCEAELTIGNP